MGTLALPACTIATTTPCPCNASASSSGPSVFRTLRTPAALARAARSVPRPVQVGCEPVDP
ncbi:MAG: hypothetical protein CG437_289 [Methanosaeta sp. NSP1]|nr:MAG: hypothetical protein CG437_289 [Methanosaeta sp. NSP1]